MEVQQRLLKEREMKIRSALEKLRRKRHLLRSQRKHKEFPVVSVLGYTNCGKTTLIKALTGDRGLQPRNQLFATLDVTVHAGLLPSHMTVLYVDTIGFLSQLPHQLIDSFSATLEDIKHSDLLVHVRDISHPETVNQKVNVLSVLKNMQIPDRLMSSMIEVHNKIDLIDNYRCPEPTTLAISALEERGMDELREAVEAEIVNSTGKRILELTVDLGTPQLRVREHPQLTRSFVHSWLYKEATVQDVQVNADEGSAVVKVIISAAAYGRYRKRDDQRAERKWTHKVPRDDVETLGVRPRRLSLQPLPQTLPVTEGQRPQGLLRVLGDVTAISCQVQARDEEALWEHNLPLSSLGLEPDVLTWTSQVSVPVQVADHSLGRALVGPPVRDGGPQLRVSRSSLGVVGQDHLVTRGPQAPQGQDGFLWGGRGPSSHFDTVPYPSIHTCVVAHLKMAGLVKQEKSRSRSQKRSDSDGTRGEFMSRQ
ncbi:hypothetical protein FQN60_013071 [Etheostoma spectabile]|uniref:Hflx-type G domain-containing protein n=1 Tax=Etheostoma spectabile TaxID=54343 RepID=A0A5J5DAQ2_9PERO|nr:hypothetical protein FQN60_013071 [Etheostoma spectabile]